MEDHLEILHREPVDFRKCQYVLAPMVDLSELPFRLLCRHYGANLCYTPMIHGGQFVKSAAYRAQEMQTCAQDWPLMVQFCANDAVTFSTAAQYVAPYCEAIDLNLGCPQQIARRGHYGAFLTEWETIDDMLRSARRAVNVPITCKIRLLDSVERTIEYARMLIRTGVSAIALHGRTREQIRDHAGAADWSKIRQVIDVIGNELPVFANGSIRTLSDVNQCIEQTKACGVLIAESALHNPAIFTGDPTITPYQVASDYLDAVVATWDVNREDDSDAASGTESNKFTDQWKVHRKWSWSMNSVRGHLFKILHYVCAVDTDVRDHISRARTYTDFRKAVQLARERCERDEAAFLKGELAEANSDPDFLPYWHCRSYFVPDEPLPAYVRRSQNKHLKAEVQALAQIDSSALAKSNDDASIITALSSELNAGDPLLQCAADAVKRKVEKIRKRKQRAIEKAARKPRTFVNCVQCKNPGSDYCTNQMCRKCCHVFVVANSTAPAGTSAAKDCEPHRHFLNASRQRIESGTRCVESTSH